MKTTLLALSFLFVSCLTFAQGSNPLVISPNPAVITGIAPSAFEGVAHANVINNTGQDFEARWERRVVEISSGWQSAVCDKNQCYFPNVGARNFNFIAGEEARMDVHVYPNNNVGAAVVEITVFNVADTTQRVVGLYYFNQTATGTVDVNRELVKVYPNPASGAFTLEGDAPVTRVEMFNLAGRLVKHFQYGDGQWYNISDLPKGTYLVRLLAADNQTVVTRLLNKL